MYSGRCIQLVLLNRYEVAFIYSRVECIPYRTGQILSIPLIRYCKLIPKTNGNHQQVGLSVVPGGPLKKSRYVVNQAPE